MMLLPIVSLPLRLTPRSPSPPLRDWIVVAVCQIPRAHRGLQVQSLITDLGPLQRAIHRHMQNVDLGDLAGGHSLRNASIGLVRPRRTGDGVIKVIAELHV